VEEFNPAYRLKEEGAILNWFDVEEPEGYLSLNDKMGTVLSTVRGKLIFATLMAKMMGGKKGDGSDGKVLEWYAQAAAFDAALEGKAAADFAAERLEGKSGSIALTQASFNENESLASTTFTERVKELQAEGKMQGITVLEPMVEGAEDVTESTNVNASIIQANPDLIAAFSWTGAGPVTWSNAARKCGKQPGDILIVSMDYTAANLEQLESDYVYAIVAQPLYDQGYRAVEGIDKQLRGESIEYWTLLDAPIVFKGGSGAQDPATYAGILDRVASTFGE